MSSRLQKMLAPAGVSIAVLAAGTWPATATAATPPLGPTSFLVHFNIDAGQLPENLAVAPDGTLDVTLNGAGQIVRVSPQGAVTVLATLPAAPGGGTSTPILGSPFTAGMARADDGNLYFVYSTGTAALNGVWRLCSGGSLTRIAPLPADSLANGIALDPFTNELYITDSALGVVWQVSDRGGVPRVWASGPQLSATGTFGANGLKIHDGSVWVSNTGQGTLLRIPEERDGRAGPIETVATGLTSIDDFAFTPVGDTVIAALNAADEVAVVRPNGSHTIVLTAADGLEGPSSIAVRGVTVYVANAAYYTGKDPNILVSTLHI